MRTPTGSTAVMARRVEPPDSLDYFPTPPWATRALFKHVIPDYKIGSVWEPACGEGHMAEVIKEFATSVFASDIFPYGFGDTHDFLGPSYGDFDWIITNPPFKVAADFTLHALSVARIGVAMLARTQWIEGTDRYDRLFGPHPLTIMAPFVERVPIIKNCWDPNASTATGYAWFVWIGGRIESRLAPIPPGRKRGLTKEGDVRRWGKWRCGDCLDYFSHGVRHQCGPALPL